MSRTGQTTPAINNFWVQVDKNKLLCLLGHFSEITSHRQAPHTQQKHPAQFCTNVLFNINIVAKKYPSPERILSNASLGNTRLGSWCHVKQTPIYCAMALLHIASHLLSILKNNNWREGILSVACLQRTPNALNESLFF